MEQVFMDIACLAEDKREETTHMELGPGVMLSQVASMTPFSDYNQSPRNMYQCQMGKQTMGTPAHALRHRSDNKLYHIQSPQAPLVQTQAHRDYCMDEYPQGANAVVAVISYTGYDMEDAMIISKGSFQRGFGHGSVYKTAVIDLEEEEKRANKSGGKPKLRFNNVKSAPGDADNVSGLLEKHCDDLDLDGLPLEGQVLEYGNPICSLVDTVTGKRGHCYNCVYFY
jgi:DNA-directed RNA polymerase I subunit RPA2